MDEITATFTGGTCAVYVGEDAPGRLTSVLAASEGAERIALVSEVGVPKEIRHRVVEAVSPTGLDVTEISFAGGEVAKTMTTLSAILEELADAGHHRRDPIVAVGGGVTGDVAGFAAATYLRGVPLIHYPTTLLAMVDSAIGGKTGVNLPAGKNLAGAFHQPLAVVADIRSLSTLPIEQMRCGLAEVAKYGFIRDPSILDDLEGGWPEGGSLESLIERSIRCKLGVVTADERETGERIILNFGHTVGHAIETASSNQVLHGEAVALGILFALELGRLLGHVDLVDRATRLFEALGLPTRASDVDRASVDAAIGLDKKYLGGRRFVLLESLAKPIEVVDPPEFAYETALAKVGIQ